MRPGKKNPTAIQSSPHNRIWYTEDRNLLLHITRIVQRIHTE